MPQMMTSTTMMMFYLLMVFQVLLDNNVDDHNYNDHQSTLNNDDDDAIYYDSSVSESSCHNSPVASNTSSMSILAVDDLSIGSPLLPIMPTSKIGSHLSSKHSCSKRRTDANATVAQ
jgi:hypothetical protein